MSLYVFPWRPIMIIRHRNLPYLDGSEIGVGQTFHNKIHVIQVYTLAEDYYKGNSNRIGATGLDILYYYVPPGTDYMDSESQQRKLIDTILKQEIFEWNFLADVVTMVSQ